MSYLQALPSPPMAPIVEWVAMVMGWGAKQEGAREGIATRRGQSSCLELGRDTSLLSLVPRRPVPGPAATQQSPLPPAPLPSRGPGTAERRLGNLLELVRNYQVGD